MTDQDELQDNQALRLAMAVGRLRARMRDESRASLRGMSITQLATLKRLIRDGATTASALAAAEYVSQQAMAQNLRRLKEQGLVSSVQDPVDKRKVLVSITSEGESLITRVHTSRDAWLVRAIESTVTTDQHAELERTIALLEQLADVHLGPDTELR